MTSSYAGGYAMSLHTVDSTWMLTAGGDNRFLHIRQ
jgi:hypothetical protein